MGLSVRWLSVEDRWPSRNKALARLIPAGASVIDLGCGSGGLAALLPDGCRYTGVDLPEYDMDRGRWPDGRWDIAVMSGVFEYARYPAAAMRHLHAIADVALISYSHSRPRDPDWNDLSEADIVRLAAVAGFTATRAGVWRTPSIRAQVIWRLA